MKFVKVILILALSSNVAVAEPNTAKVQALMEALGLIEMWQQQIDAGKKQSAEMGEKMMAQVMAELSPSPEFKDRFSGAYNSYVEKLSAPWTAKEIVNVWAHYYGPHFSNDELDKLIAFYTSELGKKDVAITKQTMTEFARHFQEAAEPLVEKATKEYIDDLKIVAKECRCKKKI